MRTIEILLAAVLLPLALTVAACPENPAPGPTQPTIELSNDSSLFAAVAGGANPAEAMVLISNAGGGDLSGLDYGVTYPSGQPAGWLWLTTYGATAPVVVRVRPQTQDLGAGTYRATLTITSPVATNSAQLVVLFTVAPATMPVISLSSDVKGFSVVTGGAIPPATTVTVTNVGAGTLTGLQRVITYGANEAAGWLTATYNTTTAPATLTLRPNSASLAPEFYQADLAVTSATASNSPRHIRVDYIVEPVAGAALALHPQAVVFTTNLGTNPPGDDFIVFALGEDSLPNVSVSIAYQTGQPADWLRATLNRTTAPAAVFLNVTSRTLPSGTYNATVTVASPGAVNSPRSGAVTLTVVPP